MKLIDIKTIKLDQPAAGLIKNFQGKLERFSARYKQKPDNLQSIQEDSDVMLALLKDKQNLTVGEFDSFLFESDIFRLSNLRMTFGSLAIACNTLDAIDEMGVVADFIQQFTDLDDQYDDKIRIFETVGDVLFRADLPFFSATPAYAILGGLNGEKCLTDKLHVELEERRLSLSIMQESAKKLFHKWHEPIYNPETHTETSASETFEKVHFSLPKKTPQVLDATSLSQSECSPII